MISLFIDTCDTSYIIGILKEKEVIYFFQSENEKDLSKKLLPKIDEAFKSLNLSIHCIDKIFVTNGPGSFTGIRVGVTVAKTLAYALQKSLIPFSKLETMTSGISSDLIVSYIDARRNYVVAGCYDNNLTNVIPDQYRYVEKLKDWINDREVTYVSNSNLIETTIKPKVDLAKIVENHWNDEVLSFHSVKPNYLKKTEAEENRDKRN